MRLILHARPEREFEETGEKAAPMFKAIEMAEEMS